MGRSCFVCVIRPIVYFTYFSYGFTKLRCPHSNNTIVKPVILPDSNRWCLTLILHVCLSAMIALTLYLTVSPEKYDYFMIFTTTELVSAQLGLIRLFLENTGWKQRLQQMKMLLSIWNYVGTFRRNRNHFLASYKFSVGAISFLACLNVLSVGYFLYGDITYITFINIFTRLTMGLLLTSTYVYTLYEFIYYYLLFKWTFEQIQREVNRRVSVSNKIVLVSKISGYSEQSHFSRRLRKLRKLYTVLLYSFHRHKKIKSVYMFIVILIYHFLLILIVFLTFIVTRGILEFHSGHLLYLFKYTSYFLYLGSIFVTCAHMQDLLQQTLTVMFKIPLNVLSPEEAREVEFFTKFLIWEQPNDSSKDLPVYKMNLLMNIIVDIITNSMIVIQLYFWFNKNA